MPYHTFDEWSAKGYRIKKGSKAIKVDGINKFSDYQVSRNLIEGVDYKSKKSSRNDGSHDQYEGEYDHQEAFEAVWE